MSPKPIPSLEELSKIIRYDPETGLFYNVVWRSNSAPAGKVTGCKNTPGYIVIRHNKKLYLAHRLAWRFIHDEDPGHLDIDHINGDTCDNRAVNLRKASRTQNLQNSKKPTTNTSGQKGVVLNKGKWIAQIKSGGRVVTSKRFESFDDAKFAYQNLSEKFAGEFSRLE